MKRKLTAKIVKDFLDKYSQIYPETLTLLQSNERMNLIDAYFRGIQDYLKQDVNPDNLLNEYTNDTNTTTSAVSN
jgi:hypothetical protein